MRISALASLTLFVLPIRAQAPASKADENSIREIIASSNDARNASDFQRFAALFTEDAELIDARGSARKGRANIQQRFESNSELLKGSHATRTVVTVQFIRPDVAVATVKGEMTGGSTAATKIEDSSMWM